MFFDLLREDFYLQEAGLLRTDVVERDVHVVGLLTHHHGVSLAERASAHILSADANTKTCNKIFKSKYRCHVKRDHWELSVFLGSSSPFWTDCCKRCLHVVCRQRMHSFWVDCNEVKYLYLKAIGYTAKLLLFIISAENLWRC